MHLLRPWSNEGESVVEPTIKNDITLVETINIGIYLARGSTLIGLTVAVHKSRYSNYKNLMRPND